MNLKKKKGPTKADLARRVKEMEAQLASTYHFASATLSKAESPALSASAVIVELTALGGKELICPVAIRGGLSPETIAALRKDIARSYDEAVEFKPVMGAQKNQRAKVQSPPKNKEDDRVSLPASTLMGARRQGWEAQLEGAVDHRNPYDGALGREWQFGWDHALKGTPLNETLAIELDP